MVIWRRKNVNAEVKRLFYDAVKFVLDLASAEFAIPVVYEAAVVISLVFVHAHLHGISF